MEEIKPDSNVIIIEQNNGLKILHQCRVNTSTAIMRTPNIGDDILLDYTYTVERRVFDYNQNKLVIYVNKRKVF